MIELTADNFSEVVKDDNVVIVKFEAEWCMPCKMMSPIIEQMAEDYPHITFATVDIESQSEVTKQYNINAVPTILVFGDGVETNRLVGNVQTGILEEICNSANKE